MILGANLHIANDNKTKLLFHFNKSNTNGSLKNDAKSPYTYNTNGGSADYKYSTDIKKLGDKSLGLMENYYYHYTTYVFSFNNLKYPVFMSFYMYINSNPPDYCYPVLFYTSSPSPARIAFRVETTKMLSFQGLSFPDALSLQTWYWVSVLFTNNYAYLCVNDKIVSGNITIPAGTNRTTFCTNASASNAGRRTPIYIDEFIMKIGADYPIAQLTVEKNRES